MQLRDFSNEAVIVRATASRTGTFNIDLSLGLPQTDLHSWYALLIAIVPFHTSPSCNDVFLILSYELARFLSFVVISPVSSFLPGMGNLHFFWPWPTWAKLGFVLGALLILVLLIASLFKVRGMLKIKRLSKKNKKMDLERAEVRLRDRSLDGIPFGDRAMNEEPEVEGVWNSRASTPLQSPVLGPRSSSPSRVSINMFSKSRRNSSVSSFTNLTLLDNIRVPQTPSEMDSSSVAVISTSSTAVAPVPRRRSVTIRATSTQESTSTSANIGVMSAHSSGSAQTRKSRVSTDPGISTPNHERRGRTVVIGGPSKNSPSLKRTPTTRKALARMEAHRKFHAAESGQLQPRSQSLEQSIPRHQRTNSDNTLPGHEAARAVSWPITPGEALIIDFNAPHKVQTMQSPPIVPFRAHIETNLTTKKPPSAWTNRTQGMLDEKLEAQDTKRRITVKNNETGMLPKDVSPITDRKAVKMEEETVSLLGTQQRRVNSGFEILPAGTLYDEHFAEEFAYLKEPLRETSNETVKPRKLQKRNRSNSRDRRLSIESMRRIVR